MSDTVKLRVHPGWSAALILGGPLIGLIVGAVLGPLSRWVLDRLDVSFWLTGVLTHADGRNGLVSFAILGGAIGIGIAQSIKKETLTIEFDEGSNTGAGVILTMDDAPRWVSRKDAAAVFRDGKDLVLTDHDGYELARGDVELLAGRQVASAFRNRDWPWQDQDPYARRFSDWVDQRPDADEDTHRLLRERRQALKNNDAGLADELRTKLADAGVVVRDRGNRQQIRTVRTPWQN